MDEQEREYDEEEEHERPEVESKPSKSSEALDREWSDVDDEARERTDAKDKPGIKEEADIRTVGRAGENNLRIEHVVQWVGIHRSGYYNISTAAGNEIQATVKQRAYKRDYGATGSLRTRVVPVAPIGTKGVLVVTDLTTGEKLERPWTWVPLNGGAGWLSRIWQTVKDAFSSD